jgi:hypothetical protein
MQYGVYGFQRPASRCIWGILTVLGGHASREPPMRVVQMSVPAVLRRSSFRMGPASYCAHITMVHPAASATPYSGGDTKSCVCLHLCSLHEQCHWCH